MQDWQILTCLVLDRQYDLRPVAEVFWYGTLGSNGDEDDGVGKDEGVNHLLIDHA